RERPAPSQLDADLRPRGGRGADAGDARVQVARASGLRHRSGRQSARHDDARAQTLMPKTGQPREVLGPGRMKGGIFRSHLQWIKDKHPADMQKVLDRLPADAKQALTGAILATSWFPFAWLTALDRAIAEQFGGGDNTIRELGKYSALINLSTTYKLLDRKANH